MVATVALVFLKDQKKEFNNHIDHPAEGEDELFGAVDASRPVSGTSEAKASSSNNARNRLCMDFLIINYYWEMSFGLSDTP